MEFVCFVRISKQTANFALHNIKRLVFITQMESVYCTVRTESLYNIDTFIFNPLNPELNLIFYLLALLSHHFLHVSRIRVKSLTIRLLMSYIYIYGASILDVSRSHTTTEHSR